jgi:lipopolysaccharide export system ATP-binding protein
MVERLRTDKIRKVYKKREVVKGIDIEVRRGEVVGLLGPNGAGKTTSFYMTVGVVKPDGGHILLDDKDITHMPMYKRARKGIGYLCQESSVFTKLSVGNNIMAILEAQKLKKYKRLKKAEQIMEELQIIHLKDQIAYTLSGGERRRVEIARVLAASPFFILLDEPFTGIDPIAVFEIQRIISQLKDKNYGILITDHSVRETLEITDRAYIMYEGEVLISGTAEELVKNEEARKIYLGEKFIL